MKKHKSTSEEALKKFVGEQLASAKNKEEEEEDKIKNKYAEFISAVKSAEILTEYFEETMHKEVMSYRTEDLEFLARHEQKWCNGFVASEAMYMLVLESTESYVENVNKLSQEDKIDHYFTFTAMQQLHGRALQQFLEIVTLMKNGFADAAYARWRSMYELTITSSFITKYGEEVAKSFIESSETEDRYEWARASGVFPGSKKHITFNAIQNACDIDSKIWNSHYTTANRVIHASPQGTFSRLSNSGKDNCIPVGRSDYGITTPAEHSAISLAQITSFFFLIYEIEESLTAVHFINNWIDVVRKNYSITESK